MRSAARYRLESMFANAVKYGRGYLEPAATAAAQLATTTALGRLTDSAVRLASNNLTAVEFYNDWMDLVHGHLQKSLVNCASEPFRRLARRRAVQERKLNGAGLYCRATRSLHLVAADLPDVAVLKSQWAPDGNRLLPTVLHEIAHVIDGPDFALSREPAWRDAFERELKDGQLTAIAGPAAPEGGTFEGFAEFFGAAYSSPVSTAALNSAFPQAYGFLRTNHLWPQVRTWAGEGSLRQRLLDSAEAVERAGRAWGLARKLERQYPTRST